MPHDNLFLKSLFFTLLFLTAWGTASEADALKDVRVGEYPNYTRIVFEFDTDTEAVLTELPDSNQLRIDFPGIRPDLIRKIPIERADRIKEIQIWKKGDMVSAIVKMAARHERIESFGLKNPYRFTVDIFWQTVGAGHRPAALEPVAPVSSDDRQTVPHEIPDVAPTASEQRQDEDSATEIHVQTITPVTVTTPKGGSASLHEEHPAALIPRTAADAPAPSEGNAADGTAQQRNWLQYYLIVGLIVLTITILGLLVLMLLTHYRGAGKKSLINADEILQQQKARIAELDERIKEQLKHYDEK